MANDKIFTMPFSTVYPFYIQKAERKGRTKSEVDTILFWLTGYHKELLELLLHEQWDFARFFKQAPCLHPNRILITGSICGQKVEEISDPLMQNIRYLDKLIDELAKGKKLDAILRT